MDPEKEALIAERWHTARKGPLSEQDIKALYEQEAQMRGYEASKDHVFSLESIHDVLRRMTRDFACASLLDVGSGPNPDLDLSWARQGARVVAAEFCFGFSAYARRRATEMGATLTVVNATACLLPFREHTFDGCILSETLEHVMDPGKALAEVHRVLKPRGYLFLTVPNERNFHTFYLWLLCHLAPWKKPAVLPGEHPNHFQHFSYRQLIKLCEGLFCVEKQYPVGFSAAPFRQQPVEWLLGKLVNIPPPEATFRKLRLRPPTPDMI